MRNFNQVGGDSPSGEQEVNKTESSFANTEFEPWDESRAPVVEAPQEQTSVEDARASVMKALKEKATVGSEREETKRVDMAVVEKAYHEELKRTKENPPDDPDEIASWVTSIRILPGRYANYSHELVNENSTEDDFKKLDMLRQLSHTEQFDYDAYKAVSRKHGEKVSSEDRETMYGILETREKGEFAASANLVLSQVRRNIVTLESSKSEDAPKSITVEKKALDTFEDLAVKQYPELKEHEKTQLIEATGARISSLETFLRLKEESFQLPFGSKEKKKKEEYIAKFAKEHRIENMNEDAVEKEVDRLKRLITRSDKKELFEEGKRRKFLYEQAKMEKGRVNGFMNKQRLKRDEYAIPDSTADFMKNPYLYPEDHLRKMTMDCVRMQE